MVLEKVIVREEREGDQEPIRGVHREAFGREDEGRLVDALREGGFVRASLVAEMKEEIIGHLLFSHLPIVNPSSQVDALALAPLAVTPGWQKKGVGSLLMEKSLDACRERGHGIVIVLGHPSYYPKFGFSAELARRLDSPYAGDSFMALELQPGALVGVTGRVEYPPPFSAF